MCLAERPPGGAPRPRVEPVRTATVPSSGPPLKLGPAGGHLNGRGRCAGCLCVLFSPFRRRPAAPAAAAEAAFGPLAAAACAKRRLSALVCACPPAGACSAPAARPPVRPSACLRRPPPALCSLSAPPAQLRPLRSTAVCVGAAAAAAAAEPSPAPAHWHKSGQRMNWDEEFCSLGLFIVSRHYGDADCLCDLGQSRRILMIVRRPGSGHYFGTNNRAFNEFKTSEQETLKTTARKKKRRGKLSPNVQG